MFETLKNAFATKEIRIKIFATLGLLLAYRLGCFIPIPGFDVTALKEMTAESEFLSLLSTITGGSLSQGTLFALGIIPFINAFIIMQLLTLIIPKLEKLSKEGGEEGRAKITQITRYVALGLAAVQAVGIMISWNNSGIILPTFGQNWVTIVFATIILVGGSVLVMWLSERITEYGIGNGTSLIIFIGMLATAAASLPATFDYIGNDVNLIWNLIGFLIIVFLIFVLIVFVDGAERRITVQYAKQVKGNKMYGGQTTHIPIRVNSSGVMPIIFASAFMSFPSMIMQMFGWETSGFGVWYLTYLTPFGNNAIGSVVYYLFMVLLIIFFAYFYAQIQFNPEDVSRNIQQYGGFLPGIRPGKPTSDYLKKISNRITLFGAIFLGFIAVVPTFLFDLIGSSIGLASAFSATGLLIVVSVALEFNKQLEAQIMMRHYKGFLK